MLALGRPWEDFRSVYLWAQPGATTSPFPRCWVGVKALGMPLLCHTALFLLGWFFWRGVQVFPFPGTVQTAPKCPWQELSPALVLQFDAGLVYSPHLYFCSLALSVRTRCAASAKCHQAASFSKCQLSLPCFQSTRIGNTEIRFAKLQCNWASSYESSGSSICLDLQILGF